VFDLVHPLAFNCFLVFGPKHQFPNSTSIQCYHCLIHRIAPIRIFNYLLKTNGFYLFYHPNHMCIVTSCKFIIFEILYKILNLYELYFNIVVKYFFKVFLGLWTPILKLDKIPNYSSRLLSKSLNFASTWKCPINT
jgi:hypothetical protein